MIEDFYKIESDKSKLRDYHVCNFCGEKLKLRARKPKSVRMFLFFLPIKRYKCTNCRQSIYKFG